MAAAGAGSEGDDVARNNRSGSGVGRDGAASVGEAALIDEVARAGSLGVAADARARADRHVEQIEQLAPAKGCVGSRVAHVSEAGTLAQVGGSGGVKDAGQHSVSHRGAVVLKDAVEVRKDFKVRPEWRGASGSNGAAGVLVGDGSNRGFDLVDHLADGLSIEGLQGSLCSNGVRKLRPLLALERDACAGVKRESKRLGRGGDVSGIRRGHRWGVAGFQRRLSCPHRDDGAASGYAFRTAVDDDALGEAGWLLGHDVAGLIKDFSESGE